MTTISIPDAALRQHIIVLGKTRSGKSSTLRGLVERLLLEESPVCIIDPKGDWWGLKSSADGKRPGFPVIIFGGEHADLPLNARAGGQVGELVATGNRPCIIDLGGWMPGDRTRFFVDFASALFRHTRGPRWLVIDEIHNFAPQGKVLDPDAGKMLHWANRLASEGSGKGVTLLSASQRPQKVHKDFVTSNETLIAMRVIHPLDRGAIKDWIDGCPDPAKGKEVLATLASMVRGEGWVWSPEIGFGPIRLQFPMFKTYDSFKAPTGEATEQLKGWASVDLEEVRVKLAAVEEEAKANDPKVLRARIAELERQARDTAPGSVDPASLATAERVAREAGAIAGFHAGYSAGVLREREIGAGGIRAEVQSLGESVESIGKALAGLVKAIDGDRRSRDGLEPPADVLAGFDPAKLTFKSAPLPKHARSVETTINMPGVTTREQAKRASRAAHGIQPSLGSTEAAQYGSALTGPEQKILDAMRWWNVLGVRAPSHAQVAFIAGYSHKSGTWATYLSRLRSAGFIEGRGDLVLTSVGRQTVHEPAIPPTSEHLRSVVLNKVDGPLARILAPIIEAHPSAISQASAASVAGYSPKSGTWATYLSRLRTLDLIDGRGELRAQDWLFP